ncbi:hypothetical protein ACIA8E_09580 [Streptomyces sp. NPDC051664]
MDTSRGSLRRLAAVRPRTQADLFGDGDTWHPAAVDFSTGEAAGAG